MKELKKSMPKCDHCGSTCGLIQFDGKYVCGDYLIRELKITQRALEIAERSASWRSAYLVKALVELYPETEQP